MPPRKGQHIVGNIGQMNAALLKRLKALSSDDSHTAVTQEGFNHCRVWSCKMLAALESSDPKEQLLNIKEVCEGSRDVVDVLSWHSLIIQFLVNIYIECPVKHPVKRLLVSSFQNFSEHMKNIVRDYLIEQILQELAPSTMEKERLRHIVDMLCALLENFKLGEECMQDLWVESLTFISQACSMFLKEYSVHQAPVQQNETMHHCLACLKTANKILQKCSGSLKKETETIKTFTETFACCGHQILLEENFLLDCKSAIGINLVLLIKLSHRNDLIPLLLTTIFDKHKLDSRSSKALPPYLQKYNKLSNIPQISYLCVCNGILGVLDNSDLTEEFEDGSCLLINILLEEFLGMTTSFSDISSKLLVAKSLTLCTAKISSSIESGLLSNTVLQVLYGDGPVLTRILQYVWMTSEDQVDAIRLNARHLFENVVKIHVLSSKCDPSTDSYFENLMKNIMEMSWSSKAKYGPLSCMLSHVGLSKILQMNPKIADDILQQLHEQSLAQYASELYQKLYTQHELELGKENNGALTWCESWVSPVLNVLCGSNRQQKTHVIEYVLPKILKHGSSSLNYIINRLSSDSQTCNRGNLGALIMCLRRARVLGLLQSNSGGENSRCFGFIDINIIKRALCSLDEQIRLDAFALFCENVKTTEQITEMEFSFLKIFFRENLHNQSPAFRQQTLCYMKKLFMRLKDSEFSLRRQYSSARKKNIVLDPKGLHQYHDFLEWLHSCFFSGIHCGSNFARRTACLSGLLLMINIFGTETCQNTDSVPQFSFAEHTNEQHVHALLECLTDTFEEIKMSAYTVLSSLHSSGISLSNQDYITSLFAVAVNLSLSTKPQDSTTSAYLFKYLLRYQELYTITKTFNEDLKFLDKTKLELSDYHGDFENDIITRTYLLVQMLSTYLMDQIEAAKRNLISAAACRPMYPTLHVIRYLLSDINFSEVQKMNSVSSWKMCLSNILTSCYSVAEVVSPVVNNSSPEGNIPESLTNCVDVSNNCFDTEEVESEKTVTLMPEYLVVCCWRSVKEVSLLLGQIASTVPVTDPSGGIETSGLLTCQQIMAIGDLFTKQLLEAIHRGAFELAYAGFIKLCDMLWKSTMPCLYELPKIWLNQILEDIAAEDPKTKLCSTRRSAGVPFYVQAIVTTEPTVTGRYCFKNCMKKLLIMALDIDSACPLNAKIHALNILRALFKDSRLGEDVTPYIADGLKSAILGFKAESWAVRNSSTLLMSAMMTRIFGVKRSKDESTLSKKNCHTGRAFFHRFPTLYQFLLEQLQEATQDISSNHLHPSLYPVLMVLGRLFPSTMEGADTNLSLSEFVPFIIRCARSPVYKTRVMAARALQPLVIKDQVDTLIVELISMIPDGTKNKISQNYIHGILLQIEFLMEIARASPENAKEEKIIKLIGSWLPKHWLLGKKSCAASKKVALEISEMLISQMNSSKGTEYSHHFETLMLVMNDVLVNTLMTECYSSDIPGYTELQITSACVVLSRISRQSTSFTELKPYIPYLLNSPSYEIRIVFLNWLIRTMLQSDDWEDQEDSVPVSLPAILSCYVSSKNDDDFKWILHSNFNNIFHLAFVKEEHHECIEKLFTVLAHHPFTETPQVEWNIGTETYTMFRIVTLCQAVIHNSKRDEVIGSVLMFIGSIMKHIYDSCSMASMLNNGIFLDIGYILKTYSSTEQSAYLQRICADFIVRNARILLIDEKNILGSALFEYWKIAVSLLQEEDLYVKETASNILPMLDDSITEPLQPFHTLNLMIGKMFDIHGERNSEGCFSTLMHWIHGEQCQMSKSIAISEYHNKINGFQNKKPNAMMVNTEDLILKGYCMMKSHVYQLYIFNRKSIEEDYGERLFDKGEMNTYKDDIMFMNILSVHFMKFINSSAFHVDCDNPDVKLNTEVKEPTKCDPCELRSSSISCDKTKDIRKLVDRLTISDCQCQNRLQISETLRKECEKILEECLGGISNMSQHSVGMPFSDTLVYAADIIQIYRTFRLIFCLKHVPLGEVVHSKCELICDVINTKFPRIHQNLLLSGLFNIFS